MSVLEVLIHIVRFPYQALKRLNEESHVGPSEWDRKSLRFWKCFAWVATALLVGGSLAILVGWMVLTRSGQ